MIVYRLAKEPYKNDLSGKGAEIAGGRWNSKGIAALYTSESRALCTAEIAVHTPLGILPRDFFLVSIDIPDDIEVKKLETAQLPHNWRDIPFSGGTQQIGNEFILKNTYLVLKVPSVVVQGDFNYLINPQHKDFSRIKIISTEKFDFDKRLFK